MRYKRYERYKDSGVDWIGDIPEHWEIKKLKHVLKELVSGGTPSSMNEENWTEGEEGINWVSISDMSNTDYVYETAKKITFMGLKEKNLKILKRGTLIYSIYATLGKVAELKIDAVTNQAILGLILKEEQVNKQFIKRYLESFERYILYLSSNNTQNNLNAEKVKNIAVVLPKDDEQTAIADFLDKKTSEIDSLIQDKEKLISLLEEKRQAIITEAVTKGLNPNVKLKDSGIEWIGEIPEHWEIKKLKYLVKAMNKKALDSDEERIYIGLEDIESRTGNLLMSSFNNQKNIEGESIIFETNDVLFGKLRPYLAKCILASFPGRCTTELLVLRCSNIMPKYIFYLMLSEKFINIVNSSTYGTKMPRTNWDFIGNLYIPLPNKFEQESIIDWLNKKCEEIDFLIMSIKQQIQKLKEYRQSLIFEAVTGKIDLRDYE